MNGFNGLGLKAKLLGMVIGLVGLMSVTAIHFIQNLLYDELMTESKKRALIIGRDIANHGTNFLLTRNIDALKGVVLDAVEEYEDVEFVYFTDYKNRIVAHSFPDIFPDDLEEKTHHDMVTSPRITMMETNRGKMFDLDMPVLKGDAGIAHVGILMEPVHRHMDQVKNQLLFALFTILLTGLVVAAFFIRYLTKPVQALTLAAEQLGRGQGTEMVAVTSNDEIGRLATTFNLMQGSLTRARKALERTNATLEERVEERTLTVRATLAQLEKEMMRRREAEKNIRALHQRNELILESAGDGICGLDTEGRTIFVNPAAARMIGWQPAELLGKPLHEIIHHHFADGRPYPIEACPNCAAYRDGRVHVVDNDLFWHRDGHGFPVESTSTPIIEAGTLKGAVITFRDITERVRNEEKLRHYQANLENMVAERTGELSRVNKELRDFVYIVSHDLRSPLLSIQGFLEELQMDVDDIQAVAAGIRKRLDPAQRDELETLLRERIPDDITFIRASAAKMDGLVDAILNLSRLGRTHLQFETLDLASLVHDNIRALAHLINESGVTITVGTMPTLTSDRAAMGQIIGNLLTNAIKYRSPDRPGTVAIAGAANPDTGQATIEVSDNGRGMSEPDIQKIFNLFQRVGRQDQPGDGMGLAYVRTLAGRLGGKIHCRSTVGQGSTFTLTLPLQPPSDNPQRSEAEP